MYRVSQDEKLKRLRSDFDKKYNKAEPQEKIFTFFEDEHFRACLDDAFNEEMGPDRELNMASMYMTEPDPHWITVWFRRDDGREDSYEDSYEAGHQPYQRLMWQGDAVKEEFDTNCSVYSWYYAMQYAYQAIVPLQSGAPQMNLKKLGAMLSFLSSLQWFRTFSTGKELKSVDMSKWNEAVDEFVNYWNKPLDLDEVKTVYESADEFHTEPYTHKYYPNKHSKLKKVKFKSQYGEKKKPYKPFTKAKKPASKNKFKNKANKYKNKNTKSRKPFKKRN